MAPLLLLLSARAQTWPIQPAPFGGWAGGAPWDPYNLAAQTAGDLAIDPSALASEEASEPAKPAPEPLPEWASSALKTAANAVGLVQERAARAETGRTQAQQALNATIQLASAERASRERLAARARKAEQALRRTREEAGRTRESMRRSEVGLDRIKAVLQQEESRNAALRAEDDALKNIEPRLLDMWERNASALAAEVMRAEAGRREAEAAREAEWAVVSNHTRAVEGRLREEEGELARARRRAAEEKAAAERATARAAAAEKAAAAERAAAALAKAGKERAEKATEAERSRAKGAAELAAAELAATQRRLQHALAEAAANAAQLRGAEEGAAAARRDGEAFGKAAAEKVMRASEAKEQAMQKEVNSLRAAAASREEELAELHARLDRASRGRFLEGEREGERAAPAKPKPKGRVEVRSHEI